MSNPIRKVSKLHWYAIYCAQVLSEFAMRLLPVAGVVALGFVSLLLYRASVLVRQSQGELATLTLHTDGHLAEITAKAAQTLDAINAPAGPSHKGGTLAQVNDVLLQTGNLVSYSNWMAREEANTMTGQIIPVLTHADDSLKALDRATADLHPLVTSATARINALEPIETNAARLVGHLDTETAPVLAHASDTLSGVDALVRNPQIPILLTNAASITSSGASLMATGDAVLKKSTHNYLHPSPNPFVRTFQTVQPYALFGARIAVVTAPAW